MELNVLILAAGKGTRMKSLKPKVMHELCCRPMLDYVIEAARSLGPKKITVVVGYGHQEIKERYGGQAGIDFVIQTEQLGTGHAVMAAKDAILSGPENVMILPGDTPLISGSILRELSDVHLRENNFATILTCVVDDPGYYGRILRDGRRVTGIVEVKDASPEEKMIKEVNSGMYVFRKEALLEALQEIKPDNAQREYYLTDAIGILARKGKQVGACISGDTDALTGINDRLQLARAASILRKRILEQWMLAGVTVEDPDTTFISADSKLEEDVVVKRGSIIEGRCEIARGALIGPNTYMRDVKVGERAKLIWSYAEECEIKSDAVVGPWSRLRTGAVVSENARVGNFVEMKNSVLGPNSKANHLSYIGDALVGADVNIGAGTITCNYDGFRKNRTVIGDGAFIGSNTALVAPVTIGEHALVAAGSTITQPVPPDALGLARARQENKLSRGMKYRANLAGKTAEKSGKSHD